MMQQRIQKRAFLNRRLPLLFKQAGITIFQFSNNYTNILFTKLPWSGDSEGRFGLRVKLPPAHLSATVCCDKLRTNQRHNSQNIQTTPAYTRKRLVFEKISAPLKKNIFVN